jgi:hypothetical protein
MSLKDFVNFICSVTTGSGVLRSIHKNLAKRKTEGRKMKRTIFVLTVSLIISVVLASSPAFARDRGGKKSYEVTITNMTRGQVFSPPIVISHSGYFQLFTPGAPAGPELYPLAEDGDVMPLLDHISPLSTVYDSTVGDLIHPGESLTLKISTRGHFKYISVAGMLVTTNDAFFAVRNVGAPAIGQVVVHADAYDAGSEANSEDCDYIPGPPCGNGGERDTEGAEGYVHIHPGIHGIEDLVAAESDWRNPVAEITIRPVYK